MQVAGLDVSFEFDGDPDAQHQLLRGLIQAGFPAIEFRGKTETLEDRLHEHHERRDAVSS